MAFAAYGQMLAAEPAHATAPYIDIMLLLDISPSMEIGATPGDIAAMMHLTPCSQPGAVFTRGRFGRLGMSAAMQGYMVYQCGTSGHPAEFNGLKCPIPAARHVEGVTVMTPAFSGPACAEPPPQASGKFQPEEATAGAPCAFACHWDAHHPLDAKWDYYGLARSTIGQPPCYQKGTSPDGCGITLRLDLVKNAVVGLVDAMQDDNDRGIAHLSVGVFTFGADVHAVYPLPAKCGSVGDEACQAGHDWPLALGSIGTAPDLPNQIDAGIQPVVTGNGSGATDFPKALKTLASQYVTRAGSGAAQEAPLKALFLVTDGLDDHSDGGRRDLGAIDPALCQTYKSMGYEVFVVYTPYYPLMNAFYLYNISKVAEGDGPDSLTTNLRKCASDPERDFIAANPADAASISRALQIFLGRAISRH